MSAPATTSPANPQHGFRPTRRSRGRLAPVISIADARAPEHYDEASRQSNRIASSPHGLAQQLRQAVLPAPATASYRWTLGNRVLADISSVVFSFLVANWLKTAVNGGFESTLAKASIEPLPLLALYGVLITLFGYSERLYHPETTRAPSAERLLIVKVLFWPTALLTAALWRSNALQLPLDSVLSGAAFSCLMMSSWRILARRMAVRSAEHGRGVRNVLIIGAGRLGRKLAQSLAEFDIGQRTVRGFLDDDHPIGGDIRGGIQDLSSVVRSEFIDEIILTTPEARDFVERVITYAGRNRIDVKIIPELPDEQPDPLILECIGDIPLLTLRQQAIPHLGMFIKRLFDLLVSTLGLTLTSPLFAALALAIKIDSPGPVFYRAPRVGLKGRHFRCCKFRTMVANADALKQDLRAQNERQGPFFKIAADPRVTRLGGYLRRYSLDELPQLWNVLHGDMSLVGPRPHPLDDFEQYSLEDLQRLQVSPGMTGLWQVTARDDPSFELNMALDLEYIRNWSVWTDLRILVRTISVVLSGSGA